MFFFSFLDPEADLPFEETPEQNEGERNSIFEEWKEAMRQYSLEFGEEDVVTPCRFWIVIRLPKENYSDLIEYHETLPMWIPKEGAGEIVGVAATTDEVDKMISLLTDKSTGENRYVYLVYAARIRTEQGWRGLLEYLGDHNMLEKY